MFKITVLYNSNIKNVYTEETVTTFTKEDCHVQYQLLLDRWFNIICKHINFPIYANTLGLNKINTSSTYLKVENKLKLSLISQTLENHDRFDTEVCHFILSQRRSFNITVTEIPE